MIPVGDRDETPVDNLCGFAFLGPGGADGEILVRGGQSVVQNQVEEVGQRCDVQECGVHRPASFPQRGQYQGVDQTDATVRRSSEESAQTRESAFEGVRN